MVDALNAELDAPVVIGDDYDFDRYVDGVPEGASIETAILSIKEDLYDPDSSVVIRKEITTTLVAGTGQVLDGGNSSAGRGRVLFQCTAAETAELSDRILYWFDIHVYTDTGKQYLAERGRFVPIYPITDPVG